MKRFGCEGVWAFDGSTLLASEESSSSTVEWRSNLLICASGEGDGECAPVSAGDVCNVEVAVVLVSIFNGFTPLLGP